MIEQIIKEKISADHLLYVSLKYTKTCDVIINLVYRWRSLILLSLDEMIKHAKKKKLVKVIPAAPKPRIDKSKEIFKKQEAVLAAIELYDFFKNFEILKKEKEHEFRKNVNLKVFYKGAEIDINLEKLKEYAMIVENFISYVKHFLSS